MLSVPTEERWTAPSASTRREDPRSSASKTAVMREPATGEIRVRQSAIGLNFIDTYHRSGLYPLPSLPSGLGVEGAGEIEAVGEAVEDLAVGQRVAYVVSSPGTYADRVLVPSAAAIPLPDDVPDETAAALLLKGMTAEYLIHRTFRVEPGMTVLVHAAAGGVGTILCQWLAGRGATVIGTVGSEAKAAWARAHGCEHPILYTKEDFADRVRDLTHGEGVPVVYDSIGRATFESSLDCLARRGLLVAYGNASGAPAPFDALQLAQKGSLYLTRPALYDYIATRAERLASANALFAAVRDGIVRAEVRQRFSLEEARAAHEALETRRTEGQSLLVPWPHEE